MPENKKKKEAPEVKSKEESKSGGLFGLLKEIMKGVTNFIRGIFTATIDTPQQEQLGNIETSSETQNKWLNSSKDPKELDQKEIKEAGKGLQEEVKLDGRSNRSIGTKAPDETPPEAQKEKSDEKQIGC